MNRITGLLLLFALTLVLAGAENASAYDSYYLFKQGNVARELGDLPKAVHNYQDYISSHPFTLANGFPGPQVNNNQYLLRNLLLAYENLFDILRENGSADEINHWLEELKACYHPEKFGSKNIYNLARIFQENNALEDSIPLLETIVHRQQVEYRPGNNKVLLRAAAMLVKIYGKQGKQEQQTLLFQNLAQCPTAEFDNKDKLKLATLYLENASTKMKGEQLLTDIVNGPDNKSTAQSTIVLKAGIHLMGAKHQSKDKQEVSCIAEQCRLRLNDDISPGTTYKVAVAFLKYNKKEQGKKLLADISKNHPNTLWARKSLFLLGRTALSEENWNAAITAYSTYITRYPEQTFFCLKAYSNLLDAYWARDGDLESQQIQITQFADILNQTADYVTLLNMARELHFKGFDELADATFTLGYTYAQDSVIKNHDTLEAIRANWQLTKYAFNLGRYDLARESGESVLEQYALLSDLLTDINEKERAGHYLSRTYLWLARIYDKTDNNQIQARKILHRFISEFPEDSDIDYATYQLGLLYEKNQEVDKATALYQQIRKGQWKEKADHALYRIGVQ
jgi:outer membrane protein assembly factor BamD (BamD/ComL family)